VGTAGSDDRIARSASIASPVGKPQTAQWAAVAGIGCSQMGQLDGTNGSRTA
jgi:hypothetical protein